MKILVLEDNQNRIEIFKKKFVSDDVFYVEHANDAIELLKNNVFDLICLDHDLGGKEMIWDKEDCGMTVADYICDNPVDSRIVIHSFNTQRALLMKTILANSEYIPGFWLRD